jgi:hypothetical protein
MNGASAPGSARRHLVPAALAAVALFLVLGWNDGHYWDEFFYLYSSFRHSPAELVRYEVRTVLFPVGFFSEKLGHIVLLHLVTGLLGGSERTLYAIQALYALLLLGSFAAAYGLLRDLLGEREARDGTLALMFSPLALYFAFKTLSEVPSLLLITLSSWAFVRAFLTPAAAARRALLALSAVALAGGALCRVTSVVGFVALGVALLVAGDERFDRRRVLLALVGIGMAGALLQALGVGLAGGSTLRVFGHVRDVVTSHPLLQRAYALGCFVQLFLLALPFAWPLRRERGVALMAVWLLVAALPFAAGHEPRYYAPAIVPFGVLAGLGIREAAGRMPGPRRTYTWVGLLLALVLVNRLVFRPLMPYEVEQAQLLALFDRQDARTPGGTLLIPWISDYSLLRFTHPASPIAFCLSNEPGMRLSHPGEAVRLDAADRWWAEPDHYVGDRAALTARPKPWIYLGWDYSPPALRLRRLLQQVGLGAGAGPTLHNHLAGSWIWQDSTITRTLIDRQAQYRAFELGPRSAPWWTSWKSERTRRTRADRRR